MSLDHHPSVWHIHIHIWILSGQSSVWHHSLCIVAPLLAQTHASTKTHSSGRIDSSFVAGYWRWVLCSSGNKSKLIFGLNIPFVDLCHLVAIGILCLFILTHTGDQPPSIRSRWLHTYRRWVVGCLFWWTASCFMSCLCPPTRSRAFTVNCGLFWFVTCGG